VSRRLVVLPEAEADILSAGRWYEIQQPGLGTTFIEALSSSMDTIRAAPRRSVRVHGRIRRALLSRFPYGVFFIEDEETVRVIAVLHVARDPGTWRRRAET
jgi:plasmid stabilization system protein ParE